MDTDVNKQPSPEGLGSIVSGIVKDLQEIVRGEVKLAKTEIREDVSAMGKGAASIAAGGIVAFVGFVFLMLRATFVLSKWVEMWIAALLLAVALLLIGAILAMSGKRKLSASSLKPTESMESLKEDQAWAS
ncbi:MAG: phage holin family protein, partial [Chloroflexia bacterium]|nr:phage holin family protein [Chloroflexia bacterium]